MIAVKALSYLDLDSVSRIFNMFSVYQQQLCDSTFSAIDRERSMMRVTLLGT